MQTSRKEVGMNILVNSSATVNCFKPRSSSLSKKKEQEQEAFETLQTLLSLTSHSSYPLSFQHLPPLPLFTNPTSPSPQHLVPIYCSRTQQLHLIMFQYESSSNSFGVSSSYMSGFLFSPTSYLYCHSSRNATRFSLGSLFLYSSWSIPRPYLPFCCPN